jgi:hypothetical protein
MLSAITQTCSQVNARTSQECAYCGAPGATTRDHVPPRSTFGKPALDGLPTVPSGAPCNNGASDDDEYFRDVVVMHHRVSELPEARAAVSAMLRAASKPNKRGYAEAKLQRFTTVEAATEAGIHLGTVPAYKVDRTHVERAVSRYVRGLYWYEHQKRAPLGSEIIVRADPEAIAEQSSEIESILRSGRYRIIRHRVFWYAWVSPADRPEVTFWLLVLFNDFAILALIRPLEASAAATDGDG